MRIVRAGTLATLLAFGLVGAAVTPAVADETSSICAVTADYVMGTSDSVVGVRLQAFDCSNRAIPFAGEVSLAQIDDATGPNWSLGQHTSDQQVQSADGAAVVALIDVGSLQPGQATVDWSLTAPGEAVPYRPGRNGEARWIRLTDGAFFPGYDWSGGTRVASTTPYGFMHLQQSLWGCDTVLIEQSQCVVSRRTHEDETWQRGYKLTITWPDPGDDALGRPYTRCLLLPRLGLFWHFSSTNPVATLGFMVNVDVPADWGSYTIPIGTGTSFPGGVTPGSTSIDVDYRCYTDEGTVHGYSSMMTVHDELIPDVPPSDPTTIDVQAAPDGIDADAGGSVARGAAPLQGYDMSVVGEDGTVVASSTVPADGMTPMTTRTTAVGATGSRSSHAFRHLKPGRYTVRVTAFNSVGSSGTLTSRTIAVTAPAALTAPRSVITRPRHGRIRISWSAPKHTGGGLAKYVVRVSKGGRLLQSATLHASARAFTTKVVHGRGGYRVTVAAGAKDGRTASLTRTVRIKR